MHDPPSPPLVSIICLCYNHERFVEDTLRSVWQQTYAFLEVIIVDDASQDNSVELIQLFIRENPTPFSVKTLFLEENLGNCAAFNCGWKLARGKYIIDLATDDMVLPERVEQQVAYFEQLPDDYGIVFTESRYINETGKLQEYHFADRYRHIHPIPTGDVYREVLSRYFISSPTVMVKNEVLQKLNGYDEKLAYEDFDLWVCSSRYYRFAYLAVCTTLVRRSPTSMSRGLYKIGDKQLYSTYLVCKKALSLNRTEADRQALAKRIKFEIRQAVFSENRWEAELFFNLLEMLVGISGWYRLLLVLCKSNIRLSWLRNFYLWIRY